MPTGLEWIPLLPTLAEVVRKLVSKFTIGKPKPGIRILSYPINGYRDLGFSIYLGVKWLLRYPNPDPIRVLDLEPPPRSLSEEASDLDVKGPYCPECETELRQSKRRLGLGYRWDCDRCGFKINSKISKYEAQPRAERVFQSALRDQLKAKENREI